VHIKHNTHIQKMELFAKFLHRIHNKVRYQVVGTREAMDNLIEDLDNVRMLHIIADNNLMIYHTTPEIMQYLEGDSIICDADKSTYKEHDIVPLVKDSNGEWRLDTESLDKLYSERSMNTKEDLIAVMDEYNSIIKKWADTYKALEAQNLIVQH
jgi:hypothetical protein